MRLCLPAALTILLLAATACGGTEGPQPATAPAEPQATTTSEAVPDADNGGSRQESQITEPQPSEQPSAPPASPAPAPAPPSSEPVYGGTLFFGLEAETPDGWNPATQSCAVSCETVMRAIFDPLTIIDADGQPQPYLLESFAANEDFTVWTFKMRPGVTFHDGTPADAAALATHFQNLLSGALAGQTLAKLSGWQATDDLTLELYSEVPFAGLPGGLAGQLGYLAAPSQYADPNGLANPVGTGPFVFRSWIPGVELVAERNPDYWRTDSAGGALPYLDRVVFRPIVETDARKDALRLGDIHVTHSDVGSDFDHYRADFKTLEERNFLQTRHLLLNNASPPFDDLDARRALALCTDYETYNLLRTDGNFDIANGPFSPDTPGHLSDTGAAGYDRAAGQALWERLEDPGTILLGVSDKPFDRASADLLVEMWTECGIDARIRPLDQGTLIRDAILGDFQVHLWRNHDGTSLASERIWWHSEFSSGLALNLGRIMSEPLDAALDEATVTVDRDELRAIAEQANRILAAGVHNVWLHWVRWMLPHREAVQNLARITLPDGAELLDIVRGRAFLTETWLAAGP